MQCLFAIALLAFSGARASETEDLVAQGGYWIATGQPQLAAQMAAKSLRADANNPEAQALYLSAWTNLGEGPLVQASLRTWWSEDKTSSLRRIALANAIVHTATEPLDAEQCDDLDALLGPDLDPTYAWRRLALRIKAGAHCPGSVTADENALAHLEGNAATEALLATGLTHPGATRELGDLLDTAPWRIRSFAALYAEGSEGPNLRRTQRRVLRTAKRLARSDQALSLQAAWTVLHAAAHPRAEHALERLLRADPEAVSAPDADRQTEVTQAQSAEAWIESGLSMIAENRPDAAVRYLARGLALGTASQPSVDRAQASLSVLWDEQDRWEPFGPAGLVAAISVVDLKLGAAASGPGSPRAFPTLSGDIALDELPGPLVVDLWATWCSPCIQAMPHLEKMAQDWPEVTFVGLSVDRKRSDLDRWLSTHKAPTYALGWTGPDAMAMLQLRGIPALFVLDRDHQVVAFIEGFQGPSDPRLARELGRLQAEARSK